MSNAGATPPPAEGSIVLPSQSTKAGLSIRSILLIMLLLVSVASSVVVGLIGYVNGRDSLQDAAFDRLTEVRDSRAREIVARRDAIRAQVNDLSKQVGQLQTVNSGVAASGEVYEMVNLFNFGQAGSIITNTTGTNKLEVDRTSLPV